MFNGASYELLFILAFLKFGVPRGGWMKWRMESDLQQLNNKVELRCELVEFTLIALQPLI